MDGGRFIPSFFLAGGERMTFDAGVSTANTLLLQLGDFIYLELSSQSGVQVSGSTAVTWGNFVSGTAWYYWDENGTRSQITGNYCVNTSSKSQTIFSSDKINCTIVSGGNSSQNPTINPSLNDIYIGCGSGNTISVTGIQPYSYEGAISIKGFASPVYSADSTTLNYNSTFVNASVTGTNVQNISRYYPNSPYLPDLTGDLSYNDAVPIVLDWVNDNLDDGEPQLTPDDVLQWEDIAPTEDPTEPETEIETDQYGNIIINNYDTLNIDNTISGNADIALNGEVNVSGEVNVNAAGGAFGAGAFAAGAFGYADIDLNLDGDFALNLDGSLDVAEISLNGDTVTYNQNYTVDSGGTVTNNNITNNYYQYVIESGSVEEIPFPSYPAIDFTLDYDEILSEREFYDILSTETYYIEPLETGVFSLELATVPPMEDLPEQLTLVSGAVISEGADLLNDFGLSSVYTPLAIFTIVCYILKRGR